jgi:hypothetical protein
MNIRTLGAKGIKCNDGQIWSADKGFCVDFALRVNKTENNQIENYKLSS